MKNLNQSAIQVAMEKVKSAKKTEWQTGGFDIMKQLVKKQRKEKIEKK